MLIYLWIILIIITQTYSQYFTYNLDDPNEVPSCTREKNQLISLFYTSPNTCWKVFGEILSYLPDDEQILLLYSMGNNTDPDTCFNFTYYKSGLKEVRSNCAKGMKKVYESFSALYRYSIGCIANYFDFIPITDLMMYDLENQTISSFLWSQSLQSSFSAIFLKSLFDLSTSRRRWFFQKYEVVDSNCVKKNGYCQYFPFSKSDLDSVIISFQRLLKIVYFHNLNTNLKFLKFQSSLVQTDDCLNIKSFFDFQLSSDWLFNQAYIKIQSQVNSTEKYIKTNFNTFNVALNFLQFIKMNLMQNTTIAPLPELHNVFISLLTNDNSYQKIENEFSKVKTEFLCDNDYFLICADSVTNLCSNYTANGNSFRFFINFIHEKIFDYYYLAVGCIDGKRFLYIYMNNTIGEEFQYFKRNGSELGSSLINEMKSCNNAILSMQNDTLTKCIGNSFNSKCISNIKTYCYGEIGYFHLLGDTQMSQIIVPLECDIDYQYFQPFDCFSFIVFNFMLGSIQPYSSGIAYLGSFMYNYKPKSLRQLRGLNMNRLYVDPDPSMVNPNYIIDSSFELDKDFNIDNSGTKSLSNISILRNDVYIGKNMTMPLYMNTSSSEFIGIYSLFTIIIIILFYY